MKTLKDIEYTYTDDVVWRSDLKDAAKQNIKQIEKEMDETDDADAEHYLFLAGKRHMFVEFFNINGDEKE